MALEQTELRIKAASLRRENTRARYLLWSKSRAPNWASAAPNCLIEAAGQSAMPWQSEVLRQTTPAAYGRTCRVRDHHGGVHQQPRHHDLRRHRGNSTRHHRQTCPGALTVSDR
jgi:hypothetical protein